MLSLLFTQKMDNNNSYRNFFTLQNYFYIIQKKATKCLFIQKLYRNNNNNNNTLLARFISSSKIFYTHRLNNCEFLVSTVQYISVFIEMFLCYQTTVETFMCLARAVMKDISNN